MLNCLFKSNSNKIRCFCCYPICYPKFGKQNLNNESLFHILLVSTFAETKVSPLMGHSSLIVVWIFYPYSGFNFFLIQNLSIIHIDYLGCTFPRSLPCLLPLDCRAICFNSLVLWTYP